MRMPLISKSEGVQFGHNRLDAALVDHLDPASADPHGDVPAEAGLPVPLTLDIDVGPTRVRRCECETLLPKLG